jgi:hypothetical protein
MYVSANEKAVSLNLHRYTAEDIWRAIMSGAAVGLRCRHSRGVSDWLHVRPELDLWVALTPGGCQSGYTDHTGCRMNCTVFWLVCKNNVSEKWYPTNPKT